MQYCKHDLTSMGASLVAQLVKNPPAMRETWVQSLGWEDPLEKGKAPTPIFWPGEFPGLYRSWGHKESDMSDFHFTGHSIPGFYAIWFLWSLEMAAKIPF